jgi:hypothetical protein
MAKILLKFMLCPLCLCPIVNKGLGVVNGFILNTFHFSRVLSPIELCFKKNILLFFYILLPQKADAISHAKFLLMCVDFGCWYRLVVMT